MPHRVVVIGAGFGGIGMAIALKQAGIDDFVVVDRAEDLGGTWRDNSYPGLAAYRVMPERSAMTATSAA